jgi:phage repressor protein C with HTH and peptisase S24 domain
MAIKENLSERLNRKLDDLDMSVPKLAQLLGIDEERIYKWKQGSKPRDPEEFLKLMRWLDNVPENVPQGTGDVLSTVPFYDIETIAGREYGADMTAVLEATGSIDVGDLLRDSKVAMRVYGNSMIPGYPPGCVIGMIQKLNFIIQPGHTYVIETVDDRFLKRLYYAKGKDSFTAYSDNISIFEAGPRKGEYQYPPFDIPKKEIKRLYDVTGVIKRNKNTIIIN